MRKLILMMCAAFLLTNDGNSQSYDDGFVTNGLPVNVNSDKFQSYVKGFNSGIDQVSAGLIRSNDDIIQTYGIDILQYPKLNDVVAGSNWGAYEGRFSPAFLRGLQAVFSKIGREYTNVYMIRSAFRELPSLTALNDKEAEALAAIDISTQEISRRFLTSLTGTTGSISFPWEAFHKKQPMTALPGWARCALGVIGEAILGGFSGIKLGGMIGGAVGGAVGGVIGVVGGAFAGAARYC
jgi:hypothetical protein